jgi:hypothetical protein
MFVSDLQRRSLDTRRSRRDYGDQQLRRQVQDDHSYRGNGDGGPHVNSVAYLPGGRRQVATCGDWDANLAGVGF